MLRAPSRTRPAHIVVFRPIGTEKRVSQVLNGIGRLSDEMAEAGHERDHRSMLPARRAFMARRWRHGRVVNSHGDSFFVGHLPLYPHPSPLLSDSTALASVFPRSAPPGPRHFAWLVRGLLASLRGLLVRLLEAIAAPPLLRTSSRLIVDGSTPIPRDVRLRVAALQERINLAALFAGQMEIAFGHCPSVRFAVPRKDSLHLTARKPAYTTRQSLAGETVGLKGALRARIASGD